MCWPLFKTYFFWTLSEIVQSSSDFYWLSTDFNWLSTDFYWLSTDFYWPSSDCQIQSGAFKHSLEQIRTTKAICGWDGMGLDGWPDPGTDWLLEHRLAVLINTGFVFGQLAIFQAGLQMHLGNLRTLHQSYTFVCILLLDNFHWQQTGMGLRNTSLYFISKTLASFLAVQNSSIGDLVTHSLTHSLLVKLTNGTFTFDIKERP